MTSVGNKLAMLFNPLRRTGPAYQAMRSDQFAKMNISGFDSPNLAGETLETFLERYHADPDDPWFHEPDVFPGLTGKALATRPLPTLWPVGGSGMVRSRPGRLRSQRAQQHL